MERKVSIQLHLEPHMKRKGRELGKDKPLTQMELATEIKVPQGTISRWMNNNVDSYNREILEKLMAFFDCELSDLFTTERTFEPEA